MDPEKNYCRKQSADSEKVDPFMYTTGVFQDFATVALYPGSYLGSKDCFDYSMMY